MDANDDDVEIQVEPDQDDPNYIPPEDVDDQGQDTDYAMQSVSGNDENAQSSLHNEHDSPIKNSHDTNGMGMQNMDFTSMQQNMQNMQMMMNGGFPSMAGMFSPSESKPVLTV
jgi:hypothetical protein